jgi:hypothetical protein
MTYGSDVSINSWCSGKFKVEMISIININLWGSCRFKEEKVEQAVLQTALVNLKQCGERERRLYDCNSCWEMEMKLTEMTKNYDQSDQDPCCLLTNPITSRETDSEQHGSLSDCADVQADLDPCWLKMHSVVFVMCFCHGTAQLYYSRQ